MAYTKTVVIDGHTYEVPMSVAEVAQRQQEEAEFAAKKADETVEIARVTVIDQAIAADATLAQLKAMSNAEFDVWWAANVTNAQQAIAVLKRLARLIIRRVL